jgi:general secretion pathway protein M
VIERARHWWRTLGRRERTMVVAAAGLVAAALVFMAGIEPAWRTRARVTQELPRLQEQLAELEALREEARLLRQQGLGRDSAGSVRADAERSLARAGLLATLSGDNARSVTVRAASVQAQAWFAWTESFAREARLQVVSASVTRASAPGMVQVEAVFEVPGR